MKIFFSLLVIANIAFGLVQWLLPYDQVVVKTRKVPVAEKLRLLNEPSDSISLAEAGSSEQEQPTQQVTEDTSDKRLCFTTGPFKDKTRALEVSGRYSGNQISSELKSSLEKEYLGVMVFISGHEDRQAAIDTAEKLASQGIREYIIINEPGKSNTLSLGVFGLKKNAERRFAQLQELNYQVETEPRYRKRTIYWLYHEQSSEGDIQSLLSDDDEANGISQIPRQCT